MARLNAPLGNRNIEADADRLRPLILRDLPATGGPTQWSTWVPANRFIPIIDTIQHAPPTDVAATASQAMRTWQFPPDPSDGSDFSRVYATIAIPPNITPATWDYSITLLSEGGGGNVNVRAGISGGVSDGSHAQTIGNNGGPNVGATAVTANDEFFIISPSTPANVFGVDAGEALSVSVMRTYGASDTCPNGVKLLGLLVTFYV